MVLEAMSKTLDHLRQQLSVLDDLEYYAAPIILSTPDICVNNVRVRGNRYTQGFEKWLIFDNLMFFSHLLPPQPPLPLPQIGRIVFHCKIFFKQFMNIASNTFSFNVSPTPFDFHFFFQLFGR